MSGYWSEYRRYDVTRDATVARLSMSDDRGGEYWSEVVVGRISEYRKSRELALDLIEAAIARGDEPGQV